MRIFEILILLSLLLGLSGFFYQAAKRPRWLRIQPLLATVFVTIHALIEGMRWQLIPSYVLTAILCLVYLKGIASLVNSTHSRGHLRLIRIGAGIGIFLTLLSAALAVVLPVFTLPKPTGPYRVGTTNFYWTDPAR